MASKTQILKELSQIAMDSETPVNHKLKALELMGKALGMFSDATEKIARVKIVDDVPDDN